MNAGCTSGIGWPVSLKVLKCGNDFYFDCQTVIDFLGIEKQIRKQGFKFVDKFLIDNGEYLPQLQSKYSARSAYYSRMIRFNVQYSMFAINEIHSGILSRMR